MENCRSCWWQEGLRCYHGNPERDDKGVSAVPAIARCENYQGKRTALEGAGIPREKLIIASEGRDQA